MATSIRGADKVVGNVRRVVDNYFEDIGENAAVFAATIEGQAKKNRPWTDRTGDARRSITGSYEISDHKIVVALAIGVDYGKYLELSNGGRYRIIVPTMVANIRRFQTDVMAQRLRL